MKKQLMTIFAGLLLAFTLATATPAQSGNCKLEQDGGSKCGDLPPIRPTTTQERSASYFAYLPSVYWVATALRWIP